MPLSPDSRIITGASINQTGTAARDIMAVVTATRTVGIGPDELEFPDPNVIYTLPGFGKISFLLQDLAREGWTRPVFVQLSSEVLVIPSRRVNLRGVALIPEVGCEMDVETFRN